MVDVNGGVLTSGDIRLAAGRERQLRQCRQWRRKHRHRESTTRPFTWERFTIEKKERDRSDLQRRHGRAEGSRTASTSAP